MRAHPDTPPGMHACIAGRPPPHTPPRARARARGRACVRALLVPSAIKEAGGFNNGGTHRSTARGVDGERKPTTTGTTRTGTATATALRSIDRAHASAPRVLYNSAARAPPFPTPRRVTRMLSAPHRRPASVGGSYWEPTGRPAGVRMRRPEPRKAAREKTRGERENWERPSSPRSCVSCNTCVA